MLKYTQAVFLTAIVAVTVIISPLGSNYVFARSVSSQDIDSQELVIRKASREVMEEYTRLLLYLIIFKLEAKLEAQ
ncbi:hypothetical protein A2392_03050 [Candidatus Kaiserbacteria bacterium RIFOXYB1_FULL_46_14]|uniref:Uncharacterized protein n=1 Tax=Candidatus Kaiserbacteria bacterium RIFOXYB1_FULL_46_14 TaxID=1798531 RepID=A0A1F6FIR0_9BACT|nr:MAG: hypothetical protein A2392_03050 [Candidatus Kaiserbacteria bacterium RIFOXYB1_FULL_46_14]